FAPSWIPSAGDEAFAVGAERHATHPVCVPLEGKEFLARPGVPHLRLPRPAYVAGTGAGAVPLACVPDGAAEHGGCVDGAGPVRPLRARSSWPLSASHPFAVLWLPMTMRLPSGLYATLHTSPVSPSKVCLALIRVQVAMLPAAQVPLALVEILKRKPAVACL